MAIVDVLIPQMGEGLHEVLITGFQKQPGDLVKRDETIYSMETDKATMDVESPYEGVLKEWLAGEGSTVPIGTPIARIETVESELAAREEDGPAPSRHLPTGAGALNGRDGGPNIPPRTRAYCRDLGLSEEEMRRIPAATGKLMPVDVDAWMAGKRQSEKRKAAGGYADRELTPLQRTFIYRLKRSVSVVVPAVAKRRIDWLKIREHAEALRAKGTEVQPTSFQTFAYCAAQAAAQHPKFRSTLIGEEKIREYEHVNLGIAVGTEDGQLATAVVPNADALDFPTFVTTAQERIRHAREGHDQATESTQFFLTYMGPYDIVDAIPVLVAPAAAILFIGSTFERNGLTLVNLVLTFDHRLITGIEAAEFLRTVVEKAGQVENFGF